MEQQKLPKEVYRFFAAIKLSDENRIKKTVKTQTPAGIIIRLNFTINIRICSLHF